MVRLSAVLGGGAATVLFGSDPSTVACISPGDNPWLKRHPHLPLLSPFCRKARRASSFQLGRRESGTERCAVGIPAASLVHQATPPHPSSAACPTVDRQSTRTWAQQPLPPSSSPEGTNLSSSTHRKNEGSLLPPLRMHHSISASAYSPGWSPILELPSAPALALPRSFSVAQQCTESLTMCGMRVKANFRRYSCTVTNLPANPFSHPAAPVAACCGRYARGDPAHSTAAPVTPDNDGVWCRARSHKRQSPTWRRRRRLYICRRPSAPCHTNLVRERSNHRVPGRCEVMPRVHAVPAAHGHDRLGWTHPRCSDRD